MPASTSDAIERSSPSTYHSIDGVPPCIMNTEPFGVDVDETCLLEHPRQPRTEVLVVADGGGIPVLGGAVQRGERRRQRLRVEHGPVRILDHDESARPRRPDHHVEGVDALA